MAIMCEKCGKRPATTLTKVYINGVYSEQYLCSECDKSYTISHELFPDNIIASLFGVAPKKRRGIRVCRNCGTTEKEFIDGYRLGCVECYNTFADMINDCAMRISGGNTHRGKSPKGLKRVLSSNSVTDNAATSKGDCCEERSDGNIGCDAKDSNSAEERQKRLRIELKKAVDEERYDDAGRIKRELDKMNGREDR